MKKIWLSVISLLLLAGCGDGTYDKAMEEGKLALAAGEFDKAEGLFQLALEEEPKDEEANQYLDYITGLDKVEDAVNKEEWDQALTKADSMLKEKDLPSSIKKALEKHKQSAESAKTASEEMEKQKAAEDAEKEKAEKGQNPVNWETYHNERFGFTINYPKEWKPAGESTNGDGRALVSGNESEVLVYASNYTPENHPDLTGYVRIKTAAGDEAYVYDQDYSFEGVIIRDGIEFHLSATMSPSFKDKYHDLIQQMFLDVKFE
jgi:hypothetical protein